MMAAPSVRTARAEFAGHQVWYLVLGDGPPRVLPKPHREPRLYPFALWLAARYLVIQIEPLGHGHSDRPHDHAPGGVHQQVHASPRRYVAAGRQRNATATPRCGASTAKVACPLDNGPSSTGANGSTGSMSSRR